MSMQATLGLLPFMIALSVSMRQSRQVELQKAILSTVMTLFQTCRYICWGSDVMQLHTGLAASHTNSP